MRNGRREASTLVTWSATNLVPTWAGLLRHLLHQPGALDDVGEARIVLDVGRDGELAAGLDALDQDRLEHGAGGVDRRRIAGRARPDDDDLGVRRAVEGSRVGRVRHRLFHCNKR